MFSEEPMNKMMFDKKLFSLILSALGVVGIAAPGLAQSGVVPAQAEAQQPQRDADPLSSIDLTPEQRQQIRAAMEETKPERNLANLRLRKARLAYDEALDADNPSEELIEQRAREFGEAQAGLMRTRAVLELRIRRLLTPQQRTRLHEIRLAQRENQRL